ncbi:serine acetyltransferase [bacterium]|nr:serine acetyltransferase [bacterium]
MESERHLSERIQSILDSYETLGGISYRDGDHLPSRSSIKSLLNQLNEILFPGYFDTTAISNQNLPYVIGQKVIAAMEIMITEIAKSLTWQARETGTALNQDPRVMARQVVDAFFDEIPALRTLLKKDIIATYAGDPAATTEAEIILAYPGFHATTVYRIAHFLFQRDVPLIPRMMTEISHNETGIDIHPGAKIGESFCIDHGTGIVIGETSEIGNNVKLYQGVTLGALSIPKTKSKKKRHPTLGDNIVVYAETTILGGDTTIGSDSVIGGNVWITQSIPANSKIYLSSDYQQLIKSGRNRAED